MKSIVAIMMKNHFIITVNNDTTYEIWSGPSNFGEWTRSLIIATMAEMAKKLF